MTARTSPASRRPLLRELALRAGIIPEYVDQSGRERRQTSDATRVALLRVMGFEASTETEARSALEALDARAATQMLAPVRVVRADDASIDSTVVVLPGEAPASIDWTLELRLEQGGTLRAHGSSRRSTRGTMTVKLPDAPPIGYHVLRLALLIGGVTHSGDQSLIVVPPRCPDPAELLQGQRVFGIVANLYTVRSERNWGVGDFEDLRALLEWGARVARRSSASIRFTHCATAAATSARTARSAGSTGTRCISPPPGSPRWRRVPTRRSL